jgi:hypothetical protein
MGGNLMEWECFQDMKNKGDWRVEAIDIDNEGAVYITIFSGPGSRKRAHEYVAMKSAQEDRHVLAAKFLSPNAIIS